MVSALDSGSGGPGPSPRRGHCVVFLGKTLYSHSASLHPGVPANVLGVALRWTSIPYRGEQQYSQLLHAKKPELSTGPMGHLGPYKGFTFTFLQKKRDQLNNSTDCFALEAILNMLTSPYTSSSKNFASVRCICQMYQQKTQARVREIQQKRYGMMLTWTSHMRLRTLAICDHTTRKRRNKQASRGCMSGLNIIKI